MLALRSVLFFWMLCGRNVRPGNANLDTHKSFKAIAAGLSIVKERQQELSSILIRYRHKSKKTSFVSVYLPSLCLNIHECIPYGDHFCS